MENYSEQQIKKMVTAYENKRTREKKYYETVKDTEEFKIANRTRANNWYMKNQKARQESYNKNKEINGVRYDIIRSFINDLGDSDESVTRLIFIFELVSS